MTEVEKSGRGHGETGFINDVLTKYLPSLQGPIYYIARPPAMVAAMRRMLAAAGVEEDRHPYRGVFGILKAHGREEQREVRSASGESRS